MGGSRGGRAVFRRVVFFYALLLACVGVGVGAAALSVALGSELLPRALLAAGIVVGGVLAISSPLGAYGTTENPGQRGVRAAALTVAALGMAASVALSIYAGISAEALLSDAPAVDAHLSSCWDAMDDTRVAKTQMVAQCCGYDDAYDRVLEPCTRYTPSVGCSEVLHEEFSSSMQDALVPAAIVTLSASIGAILCISVLIILAVEAVRDRNSPRHWSATGLPVPAGGDANRSAATGGKASRPDSLRDAVVSSADALPAPKPSSYDAWHKAVFRS